MDRRVDGLINDFQKLGKIYIILFALSISSDFSLVA